ncbi:transmembrane and TPR repeat-containing protein 1-like [Mizuhopecten yessoensis]|uniref:dolichyl-phosphate-mannose--protein mannosyltransferase n=1 Tax=Mizuhopecten yessoensis TaxID=6573 RepID=A0A210Q216_MIZYE|nr:transmembrane and TPR repeat-containing protein 1-like [Mizuhopecten yessoensis]OWF42771.1 Transmembrane and TPR repeat-containing protein 1 [Mizuhopecten yessoensis]
MELNNNIIKPAKQCKNNWKVRFKHSNIPAVIGIPVAAAVVCYINSLEGDFLHDDMFAIKSNRDARGESSLSEVFYNDFWGKAMTDKTSHKSYRPITVLTFRWNYYLSNGNPYSFHVTNVLLHAIMTGLLVYTCLDIFLLQPRVCLMTGIQFAVHPIHTEAVAGLVGRADVLAGIFFFISFILYIKSLDVRWQKSCLLFPEVQSSVLLCGSLVSGGVAMLCKEQGITVLGMIALYDILVCSRSGVLRILEGRKLCDGCVPLVKRTGLLCSVGVGLLLFRVWVMDGQMPLFQHQDNPASFSPHLLTRCLTYSYLWMYNGLLLLFPSTLYYDWQVGSIPLVESIFDLRNLTTITFFALFALLTWHWWKNFDTRATCKSDAHLVSLLLLVLPFLPASNLLFRVGFVLAERVLYIPSTGYCILISQGIHLLLERFPTKRFHILTSCTLLLLVLVGKTWNQNYTWISRESLFRSGVKILPHNAKVHYNYANYLKDRGSLAAATDHYQVALDLYHDNPSAHNNLGTLLSNKTQAEYHYKQALALCEDHKGAHVNLGSLLFNRGEKKLGISLLQRALEIDPSYEEAFIALAGMMVETKNWTEADRLFLSAMAYNPASAQAYHNYGTFLHRRGEEKKALEFYQRALEVDPGHTISIVDTARCLKNQGKLSQAEHSLKHALKMKKEDSTLDLLGVVYFEMGRSSEAIHLYEDVLKDSPNNTDLLFHYSQVLAKNLKFEKSEAALHQAIRLSPNSIEILTQMSKILGQQARHKEALPYLDHAITVAQRTNDRLALVDLFLQHGDHNKDIQQYSQAVNSFSEALRLGGDNPSVHLNLGALHHILGHHKEAKHHYLRVLSMDPSHTIAKDNLQKLERLQSQERSRL